jgi:hypothetical protein
VLSRVFELWRFGEALKVMLVILRVLCNHESLAAKALQVMSIC